MNKRIATLCLALALCLSLIPAAAFAESRTGGNGKAVTDIFTDVPPGCWYVDFLQTAYDNGIVKSVTVRLSYVSNEKTLTREEVQPAVDEIIRVLAAHKIPLKI